MTRHVRVDGGEWQEVIGGNNFDEGDLAESAVENK